MLDRNNSCYSDSGGVNTHNIVNGRIFGSVMSVLSMVGALLIIISYILFKDIRTKARFILVHLSVGDFGVGLVNFLGATIYFDQYIYKSCCLSESLPLSCSAYTDLCKTQAFFASFFTIASILWTLVLAIYVYVLVIDTGRESPKLLLRFSYLVCWGLPFLNSVWFVLTDRLGSTRVGGGGWCSLKVNDKDGNVSVFTVLFGSDLWVLTTFLLILFLYSSTHCFLKMKINDMKHLYNLTNDQLGLRGFSSDHKFLLIPLFFIILRFGSVLFSIVYVYTHLWHKMSHPWRVLIFYAMAVGDSSQGIVNGFIFCLLTPRVRQKICFFNRWRNKNQQSNKVTSPLAETAEQKNLLEKVDISYSNRYSSSVIVSSSDTDDY